MVLVDFGRKKWFGSIFAEKWASGRFWVFWGFLMSFLNWKMYFLWIFEVNFWFHGDSNPGPPARESDIMPLHYVHCDRLSEVKPAQTHLLLGWATT